MLTQVQLKLQVNYSFHASSNQNTTESDKIRYKGSYVPCVYIYFSLWD